MSELPEDTPPSPKVTFLIKIQESDTLLFRVATSALYKTTVARQSLYEWVHDTSREAKELIAAVLLNAAAKHSPSNTMHAQIRALNFGRNGGGIDNIVRRAVQRMIREEPHLGTDQDAIDDETTETIADIHEAMETMSPYVDTPLRYSSIDRCSTGLVHTLTF